MQNKLSLGTSFNSEELIKTGIANRITVLMILDKLYSVFKNNPINGSLDFCYLCQKFFLNTNFYHSKEVDVENEQKEVDECVNNKRKISNQVILNKHDVKQVNFG